MKVFIQSYEYGNLIHYKPELLSSEELSKGIIVENENIPSELEDREGFTKLLTYENGELVWKYVEILKSEEAIKIETLTERVSMSEQAINDLITMSMM